MPRGNPSVNLKRSDRAILTKRYAAGQFELNGMTYFSLGSWASAVGWALGLITAGSGIAWAQVPPAAPPAPTLHERLQQLRQAPDSDDPAEQVEPTAIDLEASSQPINPVLALLMRQELSNLIGRFESAVLLADVSAQPAQLPPVQLPPVLPVLTAAAADLALGQPRETAPHPALAEARQLLSDWDGLMQRREYAIARQRWQTARQGLWDNLPSDRPAAQAEIRAVWLDRGTLVRSRSPEGLAQVFDRLAAAGINTVFLETVNAGYPIYPSQVAPARNPLISRWDPLAVAIELAHARGMTLHAWVWTFAAGNQAHNSLLNLPVHYPGPLLAAHPDWANYDNYGNLVPPGQTKPFLDPANQEVRSYLLRLISEIITEYDVDGIQLDYIRYPFQDPGAGRTYGYGTAARWRFQAMTGTDPLDLASWPGQNASDAERRWHRQLWDRWTEFRIQQVSSFVQEASLMIQRQRPDLVLSAAVFARPEAERLQRIQQDWGTWARSGYVDWIVLMSYAEDTSRFEQLLDPWLVQNSFSPALIIPGIRLLNLAQPAALDQILATRDLPVPGYALFAAADLTQSLEGLLGRTQGQTPATPPAAPPQASYSLAHARYQSLQQEWGLLLNSRQLWMEQPVLSAWVSDVNQLEADLAALAAQPSIRQLQATQVRLGRVRAALNQGVLVQTTNSSYRLEAWRHRLSAIEQLLLYSEHHF